MEVQQRVVFGESEQLSKTGGREALTEIGSAISVLTVIMGLFYSLHVPEVARFNLSARPVRQRLASSATSGFAHL